MKCHMAFRIWFAGVECQLLFLLEALSSDNLVSLSEQQFVGCDTTDFGSNGGLVDNAFSFAKKPSTCTESSYTYKATGCTCQKFRYSVEISQGGVTGYTDVFKECKQAWMEDLSKHPVFIAIETDQFSLQVYNSGVLTNSCGSSPDPCCSHY